MPNGTFEKASFSKKPLTHHLTHITASQIQSAEKTTQSQPSLDFVRLLIYNAINKPTRPFLESISYTPTQSCYRAVSGKSVRHKRAKDEH